MFTQAGVASCLSACILATVVADVRAEAKTVTVGENDHNHQVWLDVGDTLVVKLPSNPSTGFKWNIGKNNLSLVRPIGSQNRPGNPGLIGAPGEQEFRFLAVGSGGEELSLLYQKSLRTGMETGNWYRILVTVDRANQAKTITVTENDNRGQVTLNPGDTLVVALPATAGTNYLWNVAQNDASLLQPIGTPRQTSAAGLVGGSGMQTFRFRAVGSGGVGLKFLYQNPTFRGGVQAAQRFEILVVVTRPR